MTSFNISASFPSLRSLTNVFILAAMLFMAGACAQGPVAPAVESKSGEAAAISIEGLVGTWEPGGRGYLPFGDLVITNNTLTWGSCTNVPYNVLRVERGTYYVELQRPPSCKLWGEARFMIFELIAKGLGLEISICSNRAEMDKDKSKRLCSWGTLGKKN